MSVPGVSHIFPSPQEATTGKLSFAAGDDFAGNLQLGQIIKGRILRHYEGTRYAVDFSGREKVVDSAVPLRTGDIIHGKVVGLEDRIELERVRGPEQPPARETGNAAETIPWSRTDKAARLVADLFEQYQGRLTAEQALTVEQAVRGAGDRHLMALSALLLAKLGTGFPTQWLKEMYDLLRADPNRGLFTMCGKVAELETAKVPLVADHESPSEPTVAALAEFLKQAIEECPERQRTDDASSSLAEAGPERQPDAGETGQQGGQAPHEYDLGRWLLNVQTGGSVTHRINTVPLLVNGRLLELNVAIFEQHEGVRSHGAARHRQLSFSLRSAQLGHLEAHVLLTGDHIKMRLSSDRDTTSEWLAAYSPDLIAQLKQEGWHASDVVYETKPAEAAGPARAVLQHVVSQGSVSRLI